MEAKLVELGKAVLVVVVGLGVVVVVVEVTDDTSGETSGQVDEIISLIGGPLSLCLASEAKLPLELVLTKGNAVADSSAMSLPVISVIVVTGLLTGMNALLVEWLVDAIVVEVSKVVS